MTEPELIFNNHVIKEAKSLINELKSKSTSYGEVRQLLENRKSSAMWSSRTNPYLSVLNAAEEYLEKEIDAITFK